MLIFDCDERDVAKIVTDPLKTLKLSPSEAKIFPKKKSILCRQKNEEYYFMSDLQASLNRQLFGSFSELTKIRRGIDNNTVWIDVYNPDIFYDYMQRKTLELEFSEGKKNKKVIFDVGVRIPNISERNLNNSKNTEPINPKDFEDKSQKFIQSEIISVEKKIVNQLEKKFTEEIRLMSQKIINEQKIRFNEVEKNVLHNSKTISENTSSTKNLSTSLTKFETEQKLINGTLATDIMTLSNKIDTGITNLSKEFKEVQTDINEKFAEIQKMFKIVTEQNSNPS